MSSLQPREFIGYECDHLRQNVRVAGIWHHVDANGNVAGVCEAGTYKVNAIYSGAHFVTDLVQEDGGTS